VEVVYFRQDDYLAQMMVVGFEVQMMEGPYLLVPLVGPYEVEVPSVDAYQAHCHTPEEA
jgi:hypothetical protein